MRPLVWVRITWSDGHEVLHVDVYGDGMKPGERQWLLRRPSVLDALTFAAAERDRLRALRETGEPPADELGETWTHYSVVSVS